MRTTPLALIILDGWGYNVNPENNAIAQAFTPTWDRMWEQSPHVLLSASGEAVGLPEGQIGNSEVGHMTISAGRLINQDLTRINLAIANQEFANNPVFNNNIDNAISNNKAIHIVGLLSPGGVHSHENQIIALIELAALRGANNIYLHVFLDGRDTPPQSAASSIEKVESVFQQLHCGQIVNVIGRYYAMDRDNRWDRTKQAYECLVSGHAAHHYASASEALQAAYEREETDEFVAPTIIHDNNGNAITINDGDSIIFMNFRSDRARQLTHAFLDDNFDGFARQTLPDFYQLVSLTHYADDIPSQVAFPRQTVANNLGEVIANNNLQQLRIAETEKYAHVTFFFNGGNETPYPGEDRILIPSPMVSTYDLAPAMSAVPMTEEFVKAIREEKYDFFVCNFANPDMVGHTGDYPAALRAIETVDNCLKRILGELALIGGEAIITADHGNAEVMYDVVNDQPHTAHTHEPVPFVYWGRDAKITKKDGALYDIAPTVLYLLGIEPPSEMTGSSLIDLQNDE